MKECLVNPLTEIQVCALLECADLCANGYEERFAIIQNEWWFRKLKHWRNGRTLILEWKPDYYVLKDGGRILKRCPASEEMR